MFLTAIAVAVLVEPRPWSCPADGRLVGGEEGLLFDEAEEIAARQPPRHFEVSSALQQSSRGRMYFPRLEPFQSRWLEVDGGMLE